MNNIDIENLVAEAVFGSEERVRETSRQTIRETALADDNVLRFIEGKDLRRVIVVKKKLVNIVV